MKQIKVKKGSNKYKLKGEDGTVLGEITIGYAPENRTGCIEITKLGKEMALLSIGRRG